MTKAIDNTKAMRDKQKNEIKARAEIIERTLKEFSQNNVKHKDQTSICKALALAITKDQGKPCSYTSIARNKIYRSLVERHMEENGYLKAQPPKAIENKVLALELEISSSQSEIKTLTGMLQKCQSELALLKHNNSPLAVNLKPTNDGANKAFRIINFMIKKFDLNIDRNPDIVSDSLDGSKLFDRKQLPEFFEWLDEYNDDI